MNKRMVLFAVLCLGIGIGVLLTARMQWTAPTSAATGMLSPSNTWSAITSSDDAPGSFAKIAREATPAVVTIISEKKKNDSGLENVFNFHHDLPEQGIGSGVIVREDGYIMTNNHVIEGAQRITVKLSDRRVFRAEMLGTDPLTDIALIKIDATKLQSMKIGNSDGLQVGDWVVAVGSPLSLNSTVTAGIVSAIGRQIDIIGDQYGVENFIQTDAVINPGNSGGALLNLRGELIGINTAIATKTGMYQGYGFAVPSNIVNQVMQDLSTYGKVVRGYIGVGIKDLDPIYARAVGLERSQGVLIETLTEKGAARQSGLKEGDVILEIDGRSLKQRNELQAYVALKKPGETVKLVIFRDGQKLAKPVTLRNPEGGTTLPDVMTRRPGMNGNEAEIGNGMGFEVEEISDFVKYGNLKGVLVTNSSWHAKEQNIYEGLVVTMINKRPILSIEDYRESIGGLKNGDAVAIYLTDARVPDSRIITAIEVNRRE